MRPDFQVTTANTAAVAELCNRLEGLPLALELAAARSQVLTPAQMLSRLADRFQLLTGHNKSAPPRHRTLHAAIDWSYQLLAPELQGFFARLSVFRGGWSLAAAEAVCEEPLALDYLAQLRECSLILTEEAGRGATEMRFRMLETLREYSQEKLREAGETERRQRRHRDWFLALAEEADKHGRDTDQNAWLDRLEAEHDNLRAALEWCLLSPPDAAAQENGETEARVRLVTALQRFWEVRAYFTEGRRWSQQALSLAGSAPPALRATALRGAGVLAMNQGDYAAAMALFEESLTLRRELKDNKGIADTLNNMGNVALDQGDYAQARPLFEEACAMNRALGNRAWEAINLEGLGNLARYRGEYAAALAFFAESLAIAQELGAKESIVNALDGLAATQGAQAQFEQAARLAGTATALRETIGVPRHRNHQAEHETLVMTLREALGAEAFALAWEQAVEMHFRVL